MALPIILVNFKTYTTASGASAKSLLEAMERHAHPQVQFVAAVSAFDLSTLADASTHVEVWAQHLDPVGQGGFTGWLEPTTAIHHGAKGTLLNHAEHKVEREHSQALLGLLPPHFPVCACAATVEEAKFLATLNPMYIAVEPPELIGGDISVTTADPSIVRDTVAAVKQVNPNVRVLCGAGVKNGGDVAAAIELGAEGVLLASGVTKADNFDDVLADLVSSFA